MQHMIIRWDPIHKTPVVDPYRGNVWRDDQSVMWSFDPKATNMWWDPSHPGTAIVFQEPGPGGTFEPWPGSLPAPIGPPPDAPDGRDRRRYQADAGSPNHGTEPYKYVYDAWVQWIDPGDDQQPTQSGRVQAYAVAEMHLVISGARVTVHTEPIDPEIVNQPQP